MFFFYRNSNRYRPEISYKWATSQDELGHRYIKDAGTAPKYKADLYFGRGVKLNGVDQNILIPDVVTPADTIFFTMDSGELNSLMFNFWLGRDSVNNEIHINYYDDNTTYKTYDVSNSENKSNFCFSFDRTNLVMSFYGNGELIDTLQIIAPYHTGISKEIGTINGTGYTAGITSNLIYMKGTLQPHEIMYQYTNPEKFLYHEKQADGTFIAKSEILSQEELDNVVAHFPMCETDSYVRNMIGYSEGGNIVTTNSFVDWGSDGDGTVTDNGDGSFTIEVTTATTSSIYPRVDMNQLQDRLTGETYRYDVEVVSVDGSR